MTDMVLTPVRKPLTVDELQEALAVLGLQLFRFSYAASAPHELALRQQVFIHGQESQTRTGAVLRQRMGEQHLTVYAYQRTDTVELRLQGTTGAVGWPAVSLNGYAAQTWYQFPQPALGPDRFTPLFVYAANAQSIQGIGCTPEGCGIEAVPLETILSGHEFVLVVSALCRQSE
jgi:hypothetical protein